MDIGNTVVAGNVVMLVLVAVFIVAGLTVSLITITLSSIKEAGGRTPEWPVSWPDSRLALTEAPIAISPVRGAVSSPGSHGWRVSRPERAGDSRRRANSSRWAESRERRVSPPQRADVPPQRVSVPRQRVNPWG